VLIRRDRSDRRDPDHRTCGRPPDDPVSRGHRAPLSSENSQAKRHGRGFLGAVGPRTRPITPYAFPRVIEAWRAGTSMTPEEDLGRRPAPDLLRCSWRRPGIDLACPSPGPRHAPAVPPAAAPGQGRFSRAAARTRSPPARRAAASPTARPAPPPTSAPGHLPPHHRRPAAAAPPGRRGR
jgi:hypothetical protein